MTKRWDKDVVPVLAVKSTTPPSSKDVPLSEMSFMVEKTKIILWRYFINDEVKDGILLNNSFKGRIPFSLNKFKQFGINVDKFGINVDKNKFIEYGEIVVMSDSKRCKNLDNAKAYVERKYDEKSELEG